MGFCLSISFLFSCLLFLPFPFAFFLVKEEIKPVETIRSLKLRSL